MHLSIVPISVYCIELYNIPPHTAVVDTVQSMFIFTCMSVWVVNIPDNCVLYS